MYFLYYRSEKIANKRSRFECKECNIELCINDVFIFIIQTFNILLFIKIISNKKFIYLKNLFIKIISNKKIFF